VEAEGLQGLQTCRRGSHHCYKISGMRCFIDHTSCYGTEQNTPDSNCRNSILQNIFRLRFGVLTAVTTKNAACLDVTQYGSCHNRRFGAKTHIHDQSENNQRARNNVSSNLLVTANVIANSLILFHPDDGCDTFLRYVGSNNSNTASHPRRRHSSASSFSCIRLKYIKSIFSIEEWYLLGCYAVWLL
jgi:hypothetical protein